MKAIICGANGAMGKLIDQILGTQTAGRVSIDGENNVPKTFAELGKVDADMIIDFSHHSAIADVVAYAKEHHLAIVVGTTGHTEEEKAMIYAAAQELPVFYSGNMSLGIAVLCKLAKEAAAFFPDADIEIVETHHTRKVDAPSGTAKMLFSAIKEVRPNAVENCGRSGEGKRTQDEIGIHALRMGNVVGEHKVIVATDSQTITLEHQAHSRALFAEGALTAAAYLVDQIPGLYDMQAMLRE